MNLLEGFDVIMCKYLQIVKPDSVCPRRYRLPPEAIELINSVGFHISKSCARPIDIGLYRCTPLSHLRYMNACKLYKIDIGDWIGFMDDMYTGTVEVYLNCNPDSPQYGQVLCGGDTEPPHIYNSISEFLQLIQQWICHVDANITLEKRFARIQELFYDQPLPIPDGRAIHEMIHVLIYMGNVWNLETTACAAFSSWFTQHSKK